MNLKRLNIFSEICFFISSATILLIPVLDTDSDKNILSNIIAVIFWVFLLIGLGTQLFLFIKTKSRKVNKNIKRYKFITFILFICFLIITIIAISFFRTNPIVLPIVLFLLFLSIESYSVICRMEKLL